MFLSENFGDSPLSSLLDLRLPSFRAIVLKKVQAIAHGSRDGNNMNNFAMLWNIDKVFVGGPHCYQHCYQAFFMLSIYILKTRYLSKIHIDTLLPKMKLNEYIGQGFLLLLKIILIT